MDTDEQLHGLDARGWRRGLYDDIEATFRAPIVNWIFRTTMANEPEFLRYAWGQVKPIFETRAFARLTVNYRDAVLSALEADGPLPVYRPRDVDLSPAAYRELRGQLATYDVVAPRLAVLFETMDRALHDEPVGQNPVGQNPVGQNPVGQNPVGQNPVGGRAATAPFPEWLDRDRGLAPTLLDVGDVADSLGPTVDSIQAFHGFDDGLPSIYRTLAQWPSFLDGLWTDIEPRLERETFGTACERTDDLVGSFVAGTPYRPRLSPDDLEDEGFDRETVEDLQGLFRTFNTGPVETVLPALPVFAATVDAAGERDAL